MLETYGHKRFWPMKEFQRRGADGENETKEVYRDMTTGEVHHPIDKDGNDLGWNGSPTPLPSGEKLPVMSRSFRDHYDDIRWHK